MLCPKCGATNEDSSKFCLSCGALLSEPAAAVTPPQNAPAPPVYYQQPQPVKKKKGHAGIIILIVVLFLIVIIAVGVFFAWSALSKHFTKDETTSTAQTTVVQTGQETTTAAETTTEAVSQPSVNDVLGILSNAGITGWDGNWSSLTDAQKTAIQNYYKTLGQDVEITDNGITFKTDTGGTVDIFSGTWPDSPLLKDVPKPTFGKISTTDIETGKADIMMTAVTTANFNDYVSKVESAGFTINPDTVNAFGVVSYSATNSAGLKIEISMVATIFTINVTTS
jgi:uncharacterized protein YneF (UPF0154 family)